MITFHLPPITFMTEVIGQPPKLMSFSSVRNALFFVIGYTGPAIL
ncbi:hypothetical protein PRUB_a4241 [Pseudoalteromonas rubra]|uniref:Uncharacterized protein n=1 Tax=Pseudoalteromonas rubra TaxID=43658 RepID=A0A8T0C4B8_9GAMM|nr:hypothetical protein PRUB_a4241 [Pseudoalteromonas rubra]